MRSLFLDLASHGSAGLTTSAALVACVTDQNVVSSEGVSARISDHELLPITEDVLKKAGWTYKDLTHIACVIGPGGFTSLRVAVTFANILADQLGIPLAGIHLSALYGVRVEDRVRDEMYWLHSTRKDQLFVHGGKWKEPTLVSIDEIHSQFLILNSQFSWAGELIPEHRAKIDADPVALKTIDDILPGFLAAQTYRKESLHPWYGRGW